MILKAAPRASKAITGLLARWAQGGGGGFFKSPQKALVGLMACLLLLGLTACTLAPAPPSSLEIQSIQRREFEASKTVAFAAMVSVFQDLGYSIQNADGNTGLIVAEGPSESSGFAALGVGSSSHVRANAVIEAAGSQHVNIRLSFVRVTQGTSVNGVPFRNDKVLLSRGLYSNIFQKLGDAIFIRSGTQNP